jgi:hypothetical protein
MKAYLDKETGLWKWGTNGKAIYQSKIEAEKAGLSLLCDRLNYLKDRLNNTIKNHGS